MVKFKTASGRIPGNIVMKSIITIFVLAFTLLSCSKESPIDEPAAEPEKSDRFEVAYNPFTKTVAADTVLRYTVTFNGNYNYDSQIYVAQQFCYWISQRMTVDIKRNREVCYLEFSESQREKFLYLISLSKTVFEVKEVK